MPLFTFGQIATNLDYGSGLYSITFHTMCYSKVSTQTTFLSNRCTNIQFVDKIRNIIKYFKMFKIAPTCFGSQGIHHQGALYSVWLKLQ